MRSFKKDDIIGIYMGKPFDRKKGLSVYTIQTKILGIRDPGLGFKTGNTRPYYGMGCHMLNQLPGEENVAISNTLLLYAKRDISPLEELLLDYNYKP